MAKIDFRLIATHDDQEMGEPSKELKFVVGVLMDAKAKKQEELTKAEFQTVTLTSFDTLMQKLSPTLRLKDGQELCFTSLKSLRPEPILRQIPEAAALLDLRQAIVEILQRNLSKQDNAALASLLKQAALPALSEGGVQ